MANLDWIKSLPSGAHQSARSRAASAIASRRVAAAAREIGPLPRIQDEARRERGRLSLKLFCETYFAERFPIAWGPPHLRMLDRLDECTEIGGLFALAMPRGMGKTSTVEIAAIRAIAYGLRKFVLIVGPTDRHSEHILDSIKNEVETNELLFEDFPEMCHPVRSLEGIALRAAGQILDGVRTRIRWNSDGLIFPIVAGYNDNPMSDYPSSGGIVKCVGITGNIRGLRMKGAYGAPVRPDMVIIDDPQTDESAHSITQCNLREDTITKAILGLGGPRTKMACVMPCTIIEKDDLADRFLDRIKNPEWNGEITSMIVSWPTNQQLWDEYHAMRAESFRQGDMGKQATEFYIANRSAMDDGFECSWPGRYFTDELSAQQHAMNLIQQRGKRAFMAEYQNHPEALNQDQGSKVLVVEKLIEKVNHTPRYTVPLSATRLVSFIDCGGSVLWYGTVAFDEQFNGDLIDYGTFPPQSRGYFESTDLRPALQDLFPELSEPQRVYAGLELLTAQILEGEYLKSPSNEPMKIERCMIDAGWLPTVINNFCRSSKYSSILIGSKGYSTSSNAKQIDEWTRKPGERAGPSWRLSAIANARGRQVIFDPDYWKSFLADRLLTVNPASGGCFRFYGSNPATHTMIADHCISEYADRISVRGRTFDKWLQKPDRRDNHLWDVLTGCCVAVSVQGLRLNVMGVSGGKPITTGGFSAKPKRSLTDRYNAARTGS